MKSMENHDIFNIAAHTIIKWYDQTHITMTVARKSASPLNSEIMGILLAAKKQTEGALTTLASKNILSTHALLRILIETHIILKWVLNPPADGEKSKSDKVYERFRRWDYTRLIKDKKLLENLSRTPEIESAIRKINSDIEKFKKDDVKELPNIKQLCEDMGSEWKEVYAGFYMKYCREVHLNRNITRKLAYENGEQKVIFYKDDIESEDVEFFNYCKYFF